MGNWGLSGTWKSPPPFLTAIILMFPFSFNADLEPRGLSLIEHTCHPHKYGINFGRWLTFPCYGQFRMDRMQCFCLTEFLSFV
eukprot:jgi/Botrbrau1/6321/Bobra.0339s0030.1